MQEPKTRAFIAVDIPSEIKAGIADASKELSSEGIKAVGNEQLHITLFFLGYLDEKQLEETKKALDRIQERQFGIDLKGIGTFGNRVVFVNITKGAEELNAVYSGLFEAIAALGARMERREFAPHLTIARLKRFTKKETGIVKALVKKYPDRDFGSFVCTSIKLKQSALSREGPAYTDLFVKELA